MEPKIGQLYILRMLTCLCLCFLVLYMLYILFTVMLTLCLCLCRSDKRHEGVCLQKKLTVLGRWHPCDEKLNLYISVSVLKYYVS